MSMSTVRKGIVAQVHGDILSKLEADYIEQLEHLWDMVSDCVEGGRLTEADIPDDYKAIVHQMIKLVNLEYRVRKDNEEGN